MWHDTVEELAASVRKYVQQSSERAAGPDDVSRQILALQEMGVFDLVAVTSGPMSTDFVPYVAAVGRELAGSPAAAAYWNTTAARLAVTAAVAATGNGPDLAAMMEDGARCGLRLTRREDEHCVAMSESGTGRAIPGSSWRVNGELTGLLGLEGAERILVKARLDGAAGGSETGLLLVELPEGSLTSRSSWSGESLAGVRLSGERSVLVVAGDDEAIDSLCERALAQVVVLQSVDLIELARSCLAGTVGFVRERRQFGRALASLPVVRSHLADAEIHLAVSEAVTGVALASISTAGGRQPIGPAAGLVTRLSVQKRTEQVVLLANRLTGGVGYYEDYPLAGLTRAYMVRSRMFGQYADVKAIAARHLEVADGPLETATVLRNPTHLALARREGDVG